MGFPELLLIAAGLSMDAFAVSLCRGLGMKRLNLRHAGIISLFFGGFQAAMPLAGWLLGKQFAQYAARFGDWIAFAVLVFIGTKMIVEAIGNKSCPVDAGSRLDVKELLLLAVATSVDALAVGMSFAFLQVNVLPAVAFIGVITFAVSFAGVCSGHRFGARWRGGAEIAGGAVLILIGLRILIGHFVG